MSSATVSNTFQNQSGPIPLSQLDSNFTDLTGYLNAPINRNNFAVAASGVTNTYNITLDPAPAAYSTGLEITFKASVDNTGPSVINVNGLGVKSLLNQDAVAVTRGVFLAGSTYKAVYQGTSFVAITGSGGPSWSAKAWAQFTGTLTGTVTAVASYNVSAIVRSGTGTYSVSFLNPIPSPGVCIVTNTEAGITGTGSQSSVGVTITTKGTTGTPSDVLLLHFVTFG